MEAVLTPVIMTFSNKQISILMSMDSCLFEIHHGYRYEHMHGWHGGLPQEDSLLQYFVQIMHSNLTPLNKNSDYIVLVAITDTDCLCNNDAETGEFIRQNSSCN